jgi:Ni,Fe-hydrogenase III large subunit
MTTFHNASSVSLSSIARVNPEQLRLRIAGAVADGDALLSLFALELGGQKHLCALLGLRRKMLIEPLLCPLEDYEYPCITLSAPQAHMFEREIAEQYGILPKGHPWLKPVRFHEPPQSGILGYRRPGPAVWEYFSMHGEEVHEVAVGPVHAGVIEPGHFRFQCHGENVYHLEIQLGFQHRGVENAVLKNPARRMFYMETAAGDTTCAHAAACCRVIEALADAQVSARADALRAVSVELERLACHTGDLGALAGDVGYLPTMSFCGRLRGDFLNITALVCGNRFGRNIMEEGGTRVCLSQETADELLKKLDAAGADTLRAVELMFGTPSVMSRFEGTGTLSRETAQDLGLVGPAARASGLRIDARLDFPAGQYVKDSVSLAHFHTGDVLARAQVRRAEIENSLAYIRRILPFAIGDCGRSECGPARPDALAVCVEEGWRGELVHAAVTGPDGNLLRYKITDPSFKNWTGLACALRGQQISDFPLCNKSFNLSYCGNDL